MSEGRDTRLLGELATTCGTWLLDVHIDRDHNRSVFTIAGEPEAVERSVKRLATAVAERVDLTAHTGVHPRLGSLDVVPFVNLIYEGDRSCLVDGPDGPAISARDRFARWAGEALDLPCFLYGPERSLPDVRRSAWKSLGPDFGPGNPHPTAGAVAVGARRALVAYNLWLADPDLDMARRVADSVRGPHVRTLALPVGGSAQVSCNLIDPWIVGPGAAFDSVASQAEVARAELVGLIPRGVLLAEPSHRWPELDLDPSRTIEARLESAGLDGGRFGVRDVSAEGGSGAG